MIQQSMQAPLDITDLAEGSPGLREIHEPASPLKTSTHPVVVVSDMELEQDPGVAAETGIIAAVDTAEGKDNGDSQDASRTTAETQRAPGVEKAVEPRADKQPLVMIVEDTTELAEIIQATLERMNMATVHETHGNRALAKFQELNPDVVLLDISLPDMPGWKILDMLKDHNERTGSDRKMPVVIVITAYGDPANRLVGKLQNVYSYLIKPFTSDEIEKVVIQALNSPAR
jgi:CheY-like chemotaxis protein